MAQQRSVPRAFPVLVVAAALGGIALGMWLFTIIAGG
jgi:hypothetical protein